MGTRSSTGFILQEKYKGVYNQFDGYPEGVGKDIVNTLNDILEPSKDGFQERLNLLKERMSTVQLASDDTPPTEEEQRRYQDAGYCNLGVSNQSPSDWYCLLRNLQGAAWIREVYKGSLGHILDGSDFPKDSLFCEYVYAINFDTGMLEIYKGFQQSPQEGNIFGKEMDKSGYYPCAKIIEFPLDDIPNDWMERIKKAMNEEEEEEA
jgi:hypothetical protein